MDPPQSDDRKKAAALVTVLCATATLIQHTPHLVKQPMYDSDKTGHSYTFELLNGHPLRFYNAFGMSPHVFKSLNSELQEFGGLSDSKNITTTEQLAMFVFHCRQGCGTRQVQEAFQHAPGTVQMYV